MTDVPHLAFPMTIAAQADGTLGANVVEQDSLDEILACVQAVVACPVGAWIDQPGFGIPSTVFVQAPVDASGISRAVQSWEPRAAIVGREYPDLVSEAVRYLQFDVTAVQSDQ